MGPRFKPALAALCLSTAFAAQAQVAPIKVDPDVPFQMMTSDRFTWIDSSGNPRVAVLAHNDQNGPGGTAGGELREFKYQVGGNTRDVIADPTQGAAGFGYVVSHNYNEANCVAAPDYSMLGHLVAGTWTRVFEGRHHVIFRFQQNYPRYCTDQPPAAENDLPVTIDWVFSTGRDNPLWAVTWDMSGVGAPNILNDDSRAPYGELMFDGAADAFHQSVVAGVGWGDGYKFLSTTNPVMFGSDWDWSTPNTVPFVKLWTTDVDATMGTVLTQTLAQQDAGGYFDATRWGSTSAAGDACADHYKMPCAYNWDYQSINYSLSQPNPTTSNTRLAWGTEFGFLGKSSYPVNGNKENWGGPYSNAYASGYPKKSYSAYIVLGTHTSGPVEAQVTQVETVQSLTLTTLNGSVVTTGPSGINRSGDPSDTFTYSPPGYNHVYGALAFSANANQLDANIAVGAGALTKPLIIVSNYTGSFPPSVTLNGTPLTSDIGFFGSIRTSPNELWITLNSDLAGATNHLQIAPGSSSPPAAPTGVTTRAITTSRIDISWNTVSGATYQIDRESSLAGGFVQIATGVNATTYSDTGLPSPAAFLYRVRAVNGAGSSPNSAPHIGVTIVYTDNPVSAGIGVKATHLAEIRSAVAAVRTLANSGATAFTDSATPGVSIKAMHISELRTQLDPALNTLGITPTGYTDSPLSGVVVKAVHFQELRDRMQ